MNIRFKELTEVIRQRLGAGILNRGATAFILGQCFPAFFDSRHPYFAMKIFGGTPSLFDRYKDQGVLTFGGTPGTSSRHPGWEPLHYKHKRFRFR